MDRIPIRELNQQTSRVLARVRAGESLEITDHGVTIAQLIPVQSGSSALDRLVREGQVTPPSLPVSGAWTDVPETGDPTVNVADEIVADRERERW
jgi:prevent-host-death family protein